jgi:hypothetical protein
MTNVSPSYRTLLTTAALAAATAITGAAAPASAGKEVFVRTKPHVNVSGSGASRRVMDLAASPSAQARKWCGPGGRLCIENGRWTWKKKKKK